MPIYVFRDEETEEEFEIEMKMSEREQFLLDNPTVKQCITPLNIGDPIKLGITKPPVDFQKYVLGRIKEKVGAKYATGMNRRYTIPKEI